MNSLEREVNSLERDVNSLERGVNSHERDVKSLGAAHKMRPAISVITLAVADVERARRFYAEGLGLPLHEKPPVTYFALDGTWLALFEAGRLARFAGLEAPRMDTPARVTLSCNVANRGEVDATLASAAAAGGRIVTAPRAYSWGGYAGWFEDLDGHPWEIVYNPR